MGSTLKIVNTALVLETGVATLKSRYNAADPLSIGRFQVTDYHRHEGFLNVSEIFITSSNIGSAQMALSAGINRQKDFLKSIGLLDPQSLEVPEIGAPLAPKHWREANVMTISYGYGLSISPLQLATTVAGIVNGGIMPQPTLLKRDGNKTKCLRIVSQETSIQIRKLMRAAVINGTGRKANVPQYYVTGKTGTANVREGRHYKRGSVMTSFIGTLGASMDYPQYLVLIMLEEPQGKERSFGLNAAGWNAAPTAGRIFARMAPILGTTVFINDFDEEVVSPVSQVIHQATFEE
jgi:cell division protein FtsI (penicillin-binding protein 3)